MLGIKRIVISHFDWWIYSWLCFIEAIVDFASALIGILSFGYLTTNWNIARLWNLDAKRLENNRKEKYETRSTCHRC